jgi:ATP-dependent DNA helicase RecG
MEFWRDWLTPEILAGMNLNERQILAVAYLKTNGKISNKEYQQVTNAIKKTSTRDLSDLKEKGIVEQVGTKGPSVHYLIKKLGTQ